MKNFFMWPKLYLYFFFLKRKFVCELLGQNNLPIDKVCKQIGLKVSFVIPLKSWFFAVKALIKGK